MSEVWALKFDGGSVGNPGPSAGAAILVKPDGEVLRASRFIPKATNNVAEYTGLICGLVLAKDAGAKRLRIEGDSKLVVCQFTGEWQVKEPALQELVAEARAAAKPFESVTIGWIPREQNAEADAEVRRCIDKHAPGAAGARESFHELAKLRVGGTDQFSRMKREKLLEALGEGADAAVETIARALADEGAPEGRAKLELMALRWAARGLPPEKAAQKVLVDLEIGRQAAKKRR